jgi:hypothetical protein
MLEMYIEESACNIQNHQRKNKKSHIHSKTFAFYQKHKRDEDVEPFFYCKTPGNRKESKVLVILNEGVMCRVKGTFGE